MPLVSALTFLVAATATGGPAAAVVDDGVVELRTCRIQALAFRTDIDGWMSDHCGGIFRSSDGGRSWVPSEELRKKVFGARAGRDNGLNNSSFIQALRWLTPSVGLAFVYGEQVLWLSGCRQLLGARPPPQCGPRS